jgi:anti-sigma B factor antagonist
MSEEATTLSQVAVIKVPGKFLTAFTAKTFRTDVMQLHQSGKRNFIIDLSAIEFIDSAGVGALISLFKTVTTDGSMSLCGVQKNVDEVLAMVNLKDLIPIFANAEDAQKQFT